MFCSLVTGHYGLDGFQLGVIEEWRLYFSRNFKLFDGFFRSAHISSLWIVRCYWRPMIDLGEEPSFHSKKWWWKMMLSEREKAEWHEPTILNFNVFFMFLHKSIYIFQVLEVFVDFLKMKCFQKYEIYWNDKPKCSRRCSLELLLIHCEIMLKVSLPPWQSLFSVSSSSIYASFTLWQNSATFKEDKNWNVKQDKNKLICSPACTQSQSTFSLLCPDFLPLHWSCCLGTACLPQYKTHDSQSMWI